MLKARENKHPDLYLYYIDCKVFGNKNLEDKKILLPILATTSSAEINEYGVYTNYVILYAYICKMFERISQINIEAPIYIDDKYVYIGDLYENIFPFKP